MSRFNSMPNTELNAQEPFKGTTNYTHTFTKPMRGFCIKNSGSSDIEVVINNYSFTVEAGESFEDIFYPFTVVKIIGDSKFKAYGKGSGGVATFVIIDEFLIPRTSAASLTTSSVVTNKYKASVFKMNKNKVLRSVGVNSNALSWELWEVNANNTLSTKVTSGTFTGKLEGVYNTVSLPTPITLTSGKSYALLMIMPDTAPVYNFIWNSASGTPNVPNIAYPINTDSMTVNGYSMQSPTMPTAGQTSVLTQNFVYDMKLGLADA